MEWQGCQLFVQDIIVELFEIHILTFSKIKYAILNLDHILDSV